MAGAALADPGAWVFEYIDLLYKLYGPDRSKWPPPDEVPVPWWPVPDQEGDGQCQ